MTMVGLLVRGAVAAGLLVGMGWGQAPAPSPAPAQTPDGQGGDYTLRTQANVVLMPTQVETKHGDMLYTLKADQLVVEDNGVRQTIRLDEDTDSLGLSLVVVVQCSRSALMQFNSMRGLGTMIDEITGDAPREVAIVLYGTDIETLGDFSGDPQKLQLALNDVVPCEDESKAVTLDAVDYATKMLEKRNNHYRHAVLLIGETRDHGSKMRPEQVIASLGRTNTVVDSVSFNPGKTDVLNSLIHGQMGPGPMGLLIAAVEAMRKNVPKELSGLSGGEYINFTTQKGFDAGMGRLSNHIHNYYLLSFQPGAVSGDAGATAPGLHRLTVKIPDYPDAKIRSRESYWAGSLDVPVVSGDEKDQ